MNMRSITVAAAGCLLSAGMIVGGNNVARAEDAMNPGLSDGDKKFMMDAAAAGMAEVKDGQLASEKGSTEDVKKFAQQMVTDHTKASDELKTLAGSKNVTLPADLAPRDQKMYDKLNGMSGEDFDKAYLKGQMKDHKTVVDMFEKEAARGQDRDVKEWAGKTLPTLQEHLKMVTEMKSAKAG